MQKHLLLIVSTWLGLASVASAIPVNITVGVGGALLNGTGVANNTDYAQPNNNPDSNLAFLTQEINRWNAFNPDIPAAGTLANNVESIGDTATYTAPAGYNYVVFHFGAGQAGGGRVSPGGWWQAWYLNGDGGTFTLPQVGGENVGGFSSARYYGVAVPEGGTTVLLLGASLVALWLLRRMLLKRSPAAWHLENFSCDARRTSP